MSNGNLILNCSLILIRAHKLLAATEELDKICFEFGAELSEEVVETKLPNGDKSTQKMYSFELACNRPDLLSVEGLTLAIGVYLGIKQ